MVNYETTKVFLDACHCERFSYCANNFNLGTSCVGRMLQHRRWLPKVPKMQQGSRCEREVLYGLKGEVMREKYEKPQMNADERRFVEMVSAVYNLLLWILENVQSSLKNTCRVAICLPPARALVMCMSRVHRDRKIGHALWIVVTITMLVLLLVGGGVAENSYEFVLKIPSSQQWNFYWPSGIAVDSRNIYVADSGNNRIQKFSASGDFFAKWGSLDSGDGQFNWEQQGIIRVGLWEEIIK